MNINKGIIKPLPNVTSYIVVMKRHSEGLCSTETELSTYHQPSLSFSYREKMLVRRTDPDIL
jgi:16S rRNA A1518/A1519 N6-dimethyltransferase RsmA/KsgA/DIM1 with predicted DNA glycosylase/AP lyase activity